MCDFFTFITEPENREGERFYFDWNARKEDLSGEWDSHSTICKHYKLNEDVCNKYEYNPLTKAFKVDQINSRVDDRIQAQEWVEKLNWKRIVKPLITKPIIHPFNDVPAVEQITEEHIGWLNDYIKVRASVGYSVGDSVWDSVRASVRDSVRDSVGASVGASVGDSVWASVGASVRDSVWASVGASVRDSVRDSVWASVRASVGDSVGDSVRASVRASVRDSVGASVYCYISSFLDIKYEYDFTSGVRLWQSGLVQSFDGTTWRLHTGKDAHVVYETSTVRRK